MLMTIWEFFACPFQQVASKMYLPCLMLGTGVHNKYTCLSVNNVKKRIHDQPTGCFLPPRRQETFLNLRVAWDSVLPANIDVCLK